MKLRKKLDTVLTGAALLIGIACTALSFVFFWETSPTQSLSTAMMYTVDLALLVFNVFLIADAVSQTKRQRLLNTVLGSLLYLTALVSVGCYLFGESITPERIFTVIQFTVFIAPMLVLLLPLLYVLIHLFA